MVVLPAPFGPRRPNTSPAATSKSIPSTARTSPYRLTRPWTRITGSVATAPAVFMVRWCHGYKAACRLRSAQVGRVGSVARRPKERLTRRSVGGSVARRPTERLTRRSVGGSVARRPNERLTRRSVGGSVARRPNDAADEAFRGRVGRPAPEGAADEAFRGRVGRPAPEGAADEAFRGRVGRPAPEGAADEAFRGRVGRPAPERAAAPGDNGAPGARAERLAQVGSSRSNPLDQSISRAIELSARVEPASGAGAPSSRYAAIDASSPTSCPAASDRSHFSSRTSQ